MSKNPPHKYAAVIKAWADGAQIEYKHPQAAAWHASIAPQFDGGLEYRIKPEPAPVDPFADLKAAHKAGRVIEYRYGDWCGWSDVPQPIWNTRGEYRVKAEPVKVNLYQHIIDASQAGKVTQFREATGKWGDVAAGFYTESTSFWAGPERFRVKHKWQEQMDAFTAGKQVQIAYVMAGDTGPINDKCWVTLNVQRDTVAIFDHPNNYVFRIKPATATYRKAIMEDQKKPGKFYVDTTNNESFEPEAEKRPGFVRWLGERKTVEV